MPVLLRAEGLSYYFYSNEGSERPHVHVRGNGGKAKVWLDVPPALEWSRGFPRHVQVAILRTVGTHRAMMLRAWHGHFGD